MCILLQPHSRKHLLKFPFPSSSSSFSETSSVSNSSDGGLYTNDEGRQGMYTHISVCHTA